MNGKIGPLASTAMTWQDSNIQYSRARLRNELTWGSRTWGRAAGEAQSGNYLLGYQLQEETRFFLQVLARNGRARNVFRRKFSKIMYAYARHEASVLPIIPIIKKK
jgi:hypothetical protein